MSWYGKVAIVTGSGQGIGRGIAERFAREGATVVVNDVDDGKLQDAEKAIQCINGRVLAVKADVGKAGDVASLFGQTRKAFGTVDVLVNNAGWASPIAHFLE